LWLQEGHDMAGSRSSTPLLARVGTLSLLMLSALATAVPRGDAPSYIVTDLGTFGTVQSAEAFEVNEAGQVVGRAANRAFLWQNGSKTDLGTLAGGPSAAANALNEAGQIVGYSTFAPGSPSRAVRWNGGTITNLTPDIPSNQGSSAAAINESGQIVGNIGYSVAFLWQNGARTSLGHLGGGASFASDINDSGIAVGSSYTNDMTPLGLMQHPFVWQNGVMTDLGLLPGDQDGGAAAINSAGQIVGSSGLTDPETYESKYRAFVYSNGVMTALPVPSTEVYAGDINESGTIVGTMRAGGGFSNFHAWIYTDDTVTNLNHLIPQDSGLHIAYAHAVNNAGQIAATAFDAQGRYHAVLLTPGTDPAPPPGVTIFDVSLSEGQNGTKTASFYVRLSFESASDVSVTYSTANGTATAGTDYDAVSGTLTIPAGQFIRTIGVTVRGDRKREPDEVFYMNLATPSGATIVDGQGVGTLRNDDR
jgi:probable HAF family extracellular repeat protein